MFWVVKGAKCKPGNYHIESVSLRLKLVQRKAEPRDEEGKRNQFKLWDPMIAAMLGAPGPLLRKTVCTGLP